MIRVRVKFEKTGAMRFVGHLDTQRYFQKALRRSGVPISYTNGFHPHPVISFAQPLGVGITSSGEYFDIALDEMTDCNELVEGLNREMADGFKVLSAGVLPEKAKKAMAMVSSAFYTVTPVWAVDNHPDINELRDGVRAFYKENDEILIMKKTKRSEKLVDLKPLIYSVEVSDTGSFEIYLAAGSENNIKPELFLNWLLEKMDSKEILASFRVHRNELYSKDGAPLL